MDLAISALPVLAVLVTDNRANICRFQFHALSMLDGNIVICPLWIMWQPLSTFYSQYHGPMKRIWKSFAVVVVCHQLGPYDAAISHFQFEQLVREGVFVVPVNRCSCKRHDSNPCPLARSLLATNTSLVNHKWQNISQLKSMTQNSSIFTALLSKPMNQLSAPENSSDHNILWHCRDMLIFNMTDPSLDLPQHSKFGKPVNRRILLGKRKIQKAAKC